MRDARRHWLRRSGRVGVLAALAVGAAVAGMLAFRPWERSRPFYETLPRSVVRRLDVKAKLSAGGLVESAKNTKIKCEL
ncbi:MAG TPA: hypothetical protein VGZ22_19865, partial [Isosphaeraceae bacterium]|nr:hypothetical protein [Isosphaeraceae bacterium]